MEMNLETYDKLCNATKEKLFKKVKFINNERKQLSGFNTGLICHYMASKCGIKEAEQEKCWLTYWVAVTWTITDVRNSKSGVIKKALLGMLKGRGT